ncbi:Rad50 coiled-coil Zn hook domain-containing protein [Dioscorea alata]|uniref:Rad50 coiled-coil Zn hook domain-containing protein n=1 Tax=Dioscorea alata TaxID=55571 RepID=A0ACB7UF12_DIOAL|nr:Rad50 coiled-coil Zn hook domain-containing protein [Dioscorea alata]
MDNPPAGISTSTIETQLQEDDVKELAPALTEDRMEEDKKLVETPGAAPEIPATETEDSVEEQEKTIEEGDASLQRSARIEIPPMPSTTEDQLKIDDAGQIAPGFAKEHVKEEQNLKESSDSETGKPGTEARELTEEQYVETEEGDASVETSSHELPHLQFSIENPPVGIIASTTEAQLAEDDVKELVPASAENRMGEDPKLTESSGVTSEEQVAETQGTLEEQEKVTEEGDASARKSVNEEFNLQLQAKKSPVPSTTEDQSEIEDAREFAPAYIKEHVGEENLKNPLKSQTLKHKTQLKNKIKKQRNKMSQLRHLQESCPICSCHLKTFQWTSAMKLS